MIAGGWDAAWDTWKLFRKSKLDIYFLMLAVALGASVFGAWGEGALLLFLFPVSGAMEHFALYRTLREIDSLFKAAPKEATIIDDDGSEQRLSVTQIKNGQLLLSIPSAILAAIAWGAKNGILFRGGAAVEKLAQVDLIALDKTGRLTTGNLHVQKI